MIFEQYSPKGHPAIKAQSQNFLE